MSKEIAVLAPKTGPIPGWCKNMIIGKSYPVTQRRWLFKEERVMLDGQNVWLPAEHFTFFQVNLTDKENAKNN